MSCLPGDVLRLPSSLRDEDRNVEGRTIQDTILRNWLKENGWVDPEKDVTIVGMGPGDAVTAITAGQVDAVSSLIRRRQLSLPTGKERLSSIRGE